jgi:nucleoside-diphosphate-sugar epimerase
MRVLLTGASGFVGGLLQRALADRGHEIIALDRYVTGRYVLGADQGAKTIFCDLRDAFAVRKVVREHQPEAVVHLAALSAVSYSYDHPNEVLEANLTGTINLAEACLRDAPHFRHFLFASTSETYGGGPPTKREDTPQSPTSPYAVSKLAAEKYLLYMRDAYGFPLTVLRPFNTYGRKDNTHFVVERIVVQMLRDVQVRLGDPKPVRDLLYIDDHLGAYLVCLGNPKAIGEVFNFCTGRGISIGELVVLLREYTGFQGEVVWDAIPARPLDIPVLMGDSSKADQVLGWRHRVPLEEGLRLTVEYWRGHAAP